MVQSKIREQIQAEMNAKNRLKKKNMQNDKRLKVSYKNPRTEYLRKRPGDVGLLSISNQIQ